MRQPATSKTATQALDMLSKAQAYFVSRLSLLCKQQQLPDQFVPVQWLRDKGTHGGGLRFEAPQNSLFNQASVNISQIQFEDQPDKAFISASALSTIIHPVNPLAPSVHIHISWTELRSGKSYWRLMADLNPAIACEEDTQKFNINLKYAGAEYYDDAIEQGNAYFYIPTLQKHRGVSHFYLEAFNPLGCDGTEFAAQFVHEMIDCYIDILSEKTNTNLAVTEEQKQAQLDYHTLYFYQVLTLDKGTTAGLLVHAQNDLGTLGSLPRFVNRSLLTAWAEKTPEPRNKLVNDLINALPIDENCPDVCEITAQAKVNIAQVIRSHYQQFPL